MGADSVAAWLGALVLGALSFTPAVMAPTWKARDVAGRVARLSLPASLLVAVWTTLSTLELTPPPGGVLLWACYPALLAAVGLAAWGVGLGLRRVVWHWLGVRVPHLATLALGAGSVAFALAVR